MTKNTGDILIDEYELNDKQASFVRIYCRPDVCFNTTRAYAEAYGIDLLEDYMSAAVAGCNLLKNIKVIKAIEYQRSKLLESHETIAGFVLGEWMKIAQADITEVLEITGPIISVKDLEEIPHHLRSCIKGVKTTSSGVEVTFHDKNKSLENLAKALGMFIERKQNVNEDYESLVDKVERKRAEENAE